MKPSLIWFTFHDRPILWSCTRLSPETCFLLPSNWQQWISGDTLDIQLESKLNYQRSWCAFNNHSLSTCFCGVCVCSCRELPLRSAINMTRARNPNNYYLAFSAHGGDMYAVFSATFITDILCQKDGPKYLKIFLIIEWSIIYRRYFQISLQFSLQML